MKIGFIGLGKMGSGMAKNLIQAGHELTVYNRTQEKARPLAELGAKVAPKAAETARGADAVFTMLANDAAVAEIAEELHAALGPEAVHIGSSTVSVDLAKHLAERNGKKYISAPVFGRPDAAEQKKLVVAVAGDHSGIERIRPLLDAVGRQTFVVGDQPWQANAVKLCGNFMICSMLEAFSEAFATLRKAGVDSQQFLETITTVFGSPVYTNYGKQIQAGKFDTPGAGFALKLGLKDVRLVSQFAESVESPMPLASLLKDHLVSAVANGQGDQDWTSIAQVVARAAGASK